MLTRLLNLLRPRFASSYFLYRHVRRQLAALDRAYALRLATRRNDENDEEEHRLIRHLREALPPPPPRWLGFAAVLLVIVLGRILLNGLDSLAPTGGALERVGDVLVSASAPSAKSFGEASDALLHADSVQVLGLLFAIGVPVYVLMRLPISGLRVARMILNLPRGLTWRNRRSALSEFARQADVEGHETRLFRALGYRRPRDFPLDLLVKAVVLLPLLFLGVYVLKVAVAEPELTEDDALASAIIFLSPIAVRLLWLAAAAARRDHFPFVGLLAALALVVVSACLFLSERDPGVVARERLEDSSGELSQQKRLDLVSIAREYNHLGYIDLRGEGLVGADLDEADLHGAELAGANLAKAKFRYANLDHSDLQGANLANARLRYARLTGANLRAANLSGAILTTAFYDRETVWPSGIDPRRAGAILVP